MIPLGGERRFIAATGEDNQKERKDSAVGHYNVACFSMKKWEGL